jgi:monolysocardiolipin acyltransferase
MRYFKWGIARLILEPDVCPDIVPMWIEGPEDVMHESRQFPRFLPRVGRKIQIWFGDNVGGERGEVFEEFRSRWRRLVEEEEEKRKATRDAQEVQIGMRRVEPQMDVGELSEELKFGKEAVELRMEVTRRVRREVLRVRRMRGLPDEDPKQGLVETWAEERAMGKREGQMEDGSWIKEE